MIETFGFGCSRFTRTAARRRRDCHNARSRLRRLKKASATICLQSSSARSVEPASISYAIPDQIDHVACEERLEQRDEELGREVESGIFASRLTQTTLLLKQQHAEAVEAGIAQGFSVLGDIGTETARPTGAGGEEHTRADDLLDRHPLAIAKVDQMLHEVANREVGRIALRAIAEFFAVTQRFVIRDVERLHVVAKARQRGPHELIVRQRQPPEQDGRMRALRTREGLRVGIDPVRDRWFVEAEAPAFRLFERLHFRFNVVVFKNGWLCDRRHPMTSSTSARDCSLANAGSTGSSARYAS
jgi:hypothetical protein